MRDTGGRPFPIVSDCPQDAEALQPWSPAGHHPRSQAGPRLPAPHRVRLNSRSSAPPAGRPRCIPGAGRGPQHRSQELKGFSCILHRETWAVRGSSWSLELPRGNLKLLKDSQIQRLSRKIHQGRNGVQILAQKSQEILPTPARTTERPVFL